MIDHYETRSWFNWFEKTFYYVEHSLASFIVNSETLSTRTFLHMNDCMTQYYRTLFKIR